MALEYYFEMFDLTLESRSPNLIGHKVSGVRFRLEDGEHHIVDSSEFSFMMAAQGAMKQCYERGNWHILEPIMTVEITAPDEYQGQVGV